MKTSDRIVHMGVSSTIVRLAELASSLTEARAISFAYSVGLTIFFRFLDFQQKGVPLK